MTTLTSVMLKVEGKPNIPELQRDLERKYRNVGSKIEEIWRSFTPKQREEAVRETVGDGKVLKYSQDLGAGILRGVGNIMPDWNLEDITSTPQYSLARLK